MKLCAVCDSLSPTDGPGRHASNLLSWLTEDLEAVEIVVPRRQASVPRRLEGRCLVHPLLPSRHLFFLRLPLFYPLVALMALRLLPLIRRSDVVHSIKDYPFSLIAALAAAMARKPLVVTAHGTFAVMPLERRGHRLAARWVYRRAARVLCVSHYTLERLARHVGRAKLEMVPSGVDDALLQAGEIHQPASPPFVLSVGLVRPRKGLDTSIAAFLRIAEEFPDLEYLIAGRTERDRHRERLQRLLDSRPAGRRVRFLGEVSEERLRDLYRSCLLFLLTPKTDSRGAFEGLGLVYLEAAACGKAVIAARGCGAEDAVVEGETALLVPPDDAEATAGALETLLGDAALRERLGAAGRRWAAGHTWRRTAQRVLRIYEQVSSRGSRPGSSRATE